MKPAIDRTARDAVRRSPRRLVLAALGLICVGLALAGVFLPGLPTTIFLIAASYLFTRSCPWLEERVLGWRVFRPFLPYVRGERDMPRRARVAALVAMWTAVGISLGGLALADGPRPWFAALVVAAAAVGSGCILTLRTRGSGQQALLHGQAHGVSAALGAQLGDDRRDVRVHGPRR